MLSGLFGQQVFDFTSMKNKQKVIKKKKTQKDIRMFFMSVLQGIVIAISIFLIKIKNYLSTINFRIRQMYKGLEEIYEINFVAGEEDAKLRERLRRKFDYSFVEFQNSFEPHESELLEKTFENTVYNALYTSEQRQGQLKRMNFAPKVQIHSHNHNKKISAELEQQKKKENQRAVSFNFQAITEQKSN